MKKVRGCPKKSVRWRTSGFFVAAVLAAAGFLLLTEPESARSHSPTDAVVHATKTGGPTWTNNHRTHWICPTGEECKKTAVSNGVEREINITGGIESGLRSHDKECPGYPEPNCKHSDSPDGWSKNWEYRGHSDEWNYTWSCPTTGYEQPGDTAHWGATYKGASRQGDAVSAVAKAAQSRPSLDATPVSPAFSWPHCVPVPTTTTSTTAPPAPTTTTTTAPPAPTTTAPPAPTLTVSSPSATEGSDLNFTVTLSGTSGLVSLDVRPVSASASNPGRDYEPPSVSSLSRNIAGASGGRFTFSVKTIRDTVEEGPENA